MAATFRRFDREGWNGAAPSARYISRDVYTFLKLACLHKVRTRRREDGPFEFFGADVERLKDIVERADREAMVAAV